MICAAHGSVHGGVAGARRVEARTRAGEQRPGDSVEHGVPTRRFRKGSYANARRSRDIPALVELAARTKTPLAADLKPDKPHQTIVAPGLKGSSARRRRGVRPTSSATGRRVLDDPESFQDQGGTEIGLDTFLSPFVSGSVPTSAMSCASAITRRAAAGWDNIDRRWLSTPMQLKNQLSVPRQHLALDHRLAWPVRRGTASNPSTSKSPCMRQALLNDLFIQLMKLKNTLHFLRGRRTSRTWDAVIDSLIPRPPAPPGLPAPPDQRSPTARLHRTAFRKIQSAANAILVICETWGRGRVSPDSPNRGRRTSPARRSCRDARDDLGASAQQPARPAPQRPGRCRRCRSRSSTSALAADFDNRAYAPASRPGADQGSPCSCWCAAPSERVPDQASAARSW